MPPKPLQATARLNNSGKNVKAATGGKPSASSRSTAKAPQDAKKAAPKHEDSQKNREVEEYDTLEYIVPLPEDEIAKRFTTSGAEGEGDDEEQQEPDQRISMKLIAKRAIGEERVSEIGADEIAKEVFSLAHVRLDEERIAEIENMEALGDVTHLFLQRNRITKIQGLESLRSLQLLTLSSNDIMTVENLTCLQNLKALDLSYNLINFVPPTELPPSILYLTTDGNPLLQMDDDAWMEVYDALPELRQHDCEDVYDTASDDDDGGSGAESEERARRERGGVAEEEEESTAAAREKEEEEEEEEEEGFRREEEKLALLSRLMGGHAALMHASQVFDSSIEALKLNRAQMLQRQQSELEQERLRHHESMEEARREMEAMRARLLLAPASSSAAGSRPPSALALAAGAESRPPLELPAKYDVPLAVSSEARALAEKQLEGNLKARVQRPAPQPQPQPELPASAPAPAPEEEFSDPD